MSAVKAVYSLLTGNSALIAVVPAAKISAGPIPQGTAAPAISIEHVSTVRLQNVAAANGFCRSRVQVTVAAVTYPSLRSTLDLVRGALPRARGTHNGVKVDSVIVESEGPDGSDEDSGLFFGSLDVIVHFNE